MVRTNLSLLTGILAFLFLSTNSFSQHHKFGFQAYLDKAPNDITTFCVPNDAQTKELLNKERITIKYQTANWLFISTTASWIDAKTKSRELSNYYFEYAPPVALADSALVKHNVVQVHNGLGGLSSSYTGKDVIVGFVDQGIDWNHPADEHSLLFSKLRAALALYQHFSLPHLPLPQNISWTNSNPPSQYQIM